MKPAVSKNRLIIPFVLKFLSFIPVFGSISDELCCGKSEDWTWPT